MNKRKLRIGIFIDHDIMIRHFIHSQVFLELSKKHKVDYFFPSVGHKRVTLDPTPYIKNARIFRLPENIIRKSNGKKIETPNINAVTRNFPGSGNLSDFQIIIPSIIGGTTVAR